MLLLDELLQLDREHMLDLRDPRELGELGGVCRFQDDVPGLPTFRLDMTVSLEEGKSNGSTVKLRSESIIS